MSITSGLSHSKRLFLGVLVLLTVDAIWVASSELTRYIFKDEGYDKPFFSTYLKTSMFMLYLLGFIFWRPWRKMCSECIGKPSAHPTDIQSNPENIQGDKERLLGDPLYVPVKFCDSDKESTDSRHSSISEPCESPVKIGRVRFSNLMEVRQMSESQGKEAMLSRMPYHVAQRNNLVTPPPVGEKLPLSQVAKISLSFCIVWFLANFSYQEALDDTQMAVVNTLSSTSGVFTMILAALYPSSSGDKFTLTKFVSVLISVSGIAMVSFSKTNQDQETLKVGSLWALAGALLYAIYLVMLKRRVDNEDSLDLPMFFGFVGLFNFVLIWPGLIILHVANWETLEMPSVKVWLYLALNGIVGTVISEFLWLWGCFLTSSLIATLALSLTLPISIFLDMYLSGVSFSLLFFVGAVPIFVSFFAVSILNQYNDWDPLWVGIRRLYSLLKPYICCWCNRRRKLLMRLAEDKEQSVSLIPDGVKAEETEHISDSENHY
ncbi:solute carrier family 35 member F5-like isoform X1 [Asterias rubens]|uniref:solute carrier family 35 member F5-like isoform X1 n=2 Tax=Asterias rubens TaxID=7604 RepID=UPI001455A6EE|nr:solute carrier family 35 member F5-like isoform X1 [Asterias rubens]XP_033628996.1 solute carrier family 35 member F5-like isoform X1 [Asterias rubens]